MDAVHGSLQQIETLRQSVDALTQEQKKASEDHSVRASELSDAQQKVSDAQRSLKWADDSLLTFHGWQTATSAQGVGGYFEQIDRSQAELEAAGFVELGWSSDRQTEWKKAIALLSANFQKNYGA